MRSFKNKNSFKGAYYVSIILDRDQTTVYDFSLHDSSLSRTYTLDSDLYIQESTQVFFQKTDPCLFDYVLTLEIQKNEYFQYRKELHSINSSRALYIDFCQNGGWKDLFKPLHPELVI